MSKDKRTLGKMLLLSIQQLFMFPNRLPKIWNNLIRQKMIPHENYLKLLPNPPHTQMNLHQNYI